MSGVASQLAFDFMLGENAMTFASMKRKHKNGLNRFRFRIQTFLFDVNETAIIGRAEHPGNKYRSLEEV